LSNPTSPTEVGHYDTGGNAWEVYVKDNYAFVADGSDGLRVIDISNPAAPGEVGYVDTPGDAQGVYVNGNYAYVADYTMGLRIIDVSNPSSPTEIGFHDTPGYAYKVSVSNNFAYVADDYTGLQIIDVSDPTSPKKVGYYERCTFAVDLDVKGNYVFIADGDDGLYVLRNDLITGITKKNVSLLRTFKLAQNFPNPFNPTTTIKFSIPETSNITLQIFDLNGQVIRTLLEGYYPSGSYSVEWNGLDDAGRPVSSGMYLYKLKTNQHVAARKMLLVR